MPRTDLYLQRPLNPDEIEEALCQACEIKAKDHLEKVPRAKPAIFWDTRDPSNPTTYANVSKAMSGEACLLVCRVHGSRHALEFPSPASCALFLRQTYAGYQWKTFRDGAGIQGEFKGAGDIEVIIEFSGEKVLPAPVVEIAALRPDAKPEDLYIISNSSVVQQQAMLDVLKS